MNWSLGKSGILIGAISLFVSCGSNKVVINNITKPTEEAVKLFETYTTENDGKTLKGIIQPSQIISDTSFTWYQENLKWFKADSSTVQAMRSQISKVHYTIFIGTWCEDSQSILPKYLTLLNAANVPNEDITLIAVDRNKTTIAHLEKVFGVTNIPTLILRKGDKEVGRIVEYGNTGLPAQALDELIKQVN